MDKTTKIQTIAVPCCDGTGWTGDPRERCVDHYEPLDAIWFS